MRAVLGSLLLTGLMWAGLIQDAPPVKMGLWESTELSTITDMPESMRAAMKQGGLEQGKVITEKRHACYTPELWDKMVGLKPASTHCQDKNSALTGKNATVSYVCNIGGVTLTTVSSFTFSSPEAWHAEGTSISAYPASMMGGGQMKTKVRFDAKYLGSSCGDVPTGKSVSVP